MLFDMRTSSGVSVRSETVKVRSERASQTTVKHEADGRSSVELLKVGHKLCACTSSLLLLSVERIQMASATISITFEELLEEHGLTTSVATAKLAEQDKENSQARQGTGVDALEGDDTELLSDHDPPGADAEPIMYRRYYLRSSAKPSDGPSEAPSDAICRQDATP
jgi:hypothetical protein